MARVEIFLVVLLQLFGLYLFFRFLHIMEEGS